jgi:hypothetical protein
LYRSIAGDLLADIYVPQFSHGKKAGAFENQNDRDTVVTSDNLCDPT